LANEERRGPGYTLAERIRYDEKEVKLWIVTIWEMDFVKKNDPDMMTATEMMKLLKVSKTTLLRLRKEGKPYTKVQNRVAYECEKVEEWIEKNNKIK
jgi:hypothetical protein